MSKVLVVDDERDFVELISFNLRRHGHDVITALNGLEALNHAVKRPPDLILTDVMMPGIDGFSLCEILRRRPSTSAVPVVMYTALAGQIAKFNGFESGADEYLTKPFRMSELIARVERRLQLPREKKRRDF